MVRRRRRQLFMILLELTILSLLIAVFPPFHRLLPAAAVLVGVLALYVLVLVKLRADEVQHARARRAMETAAARRAAGGPARARPLARTVAGNGHPARERSLAAGGAVPAGRKNGNGHGFRPGGGGPESWAGIATPAYLREGGVKIVDDDVHVIVYRSDEIDASTLRTAAR
jgi:hypothetical protein